LSRQPDYKDAPAQRDEAQQQLDMAQKYEEAVNKIDQAEQQPENWQLAADALQTVAQWQPDYQDTASLLKKVQPEAKLYSLYQRATVLGAKNEIPDLEEAINLLGQITKIDLNYRDAAPLKGKYEAKLVEKQEEERRIEIRTRFNLALQNAKKGEFEQVLTQLEQITRLDEQYQSVWDDINKHIQRCLVKYHQGQQLKADKKKTAEALAILEEYRQDKLNLPGIIQGILQQNSPE
jgi:tetratricopeptide (TPR) repeat protein